MAAPKALDPLLVALRSAMPLVRQAWGIPPRQKLKSRFLGLEDFQQALSIRFARAPMLHSLDQVLRFSRNGSDFFEAFDELIHQDLRLFQIGSNLFETLDELLSHDGRHPFCGHDSGWDAGFIGSHPRCQAGLSEGHCEADAQQALSACEQDLQVTQCAQTTMRPIARYGQRGRPRPGASPEQIV